MMGFVILRVDEGRELTRLEFEEAVRAGVEELVCELPTGAARTAVRVPLFGSSACGVRVGGR
jgi:hypothetical protein